VIVRLCTWQNTANSGQSLLKKLNKEILFAGSMVEGKDKGGQGQFGKDVRCCSQDKPFLKWQG